MNTVRKNIVIALAAFGIAGASIGVQAQTGVNLAVGVTEFNLRTAAG